MKYWRHKPVGMLLTALLCLPVAGAGGAQMPTISMNWVKLYHGFDLMKTNGNEIVLSRGSDELRFAGNSRRLELNGVTVWMNEPLLQRWGAWRISKADLDKTVMPLLRPAEFLGGAGDSLIVLDAGHGGRDMGVTDPWQGRKEKDLTFRLAVTARDILLDRRFAVHLTREADEGVGLGERCGRAAEAGADVFVSIHLNGAANQDASGIETHILPLPGSPTTATPSSESEPNAAPACLGNGHDAANTVLGFMLQSRLVERSGSLDRGVRRSRFQVLRNSPCPAALVECGFMTNKEESERLTDDAYCHAIAEAIADGIAGYLAEVQKARR